MRCKSVKHGVLAVLLLTGLTWPVLSFMSGQEDRPARAAGLSAQLSDPARAAGFVPHKALYDIQLVSTRSGSQILNISGRMFFKWEPVCGAWISDHRFKLTYEYADSVPMKITSNFSTYETFDGTRLDFTSRRKRDGELFQELRGQADMAGNKREALYNKPAGLEYQLPAGALFPMGHTIEVLEHIKAGKTLFTSTVFDGSDEDGPVDISTFIGPRLEGEDLAPVSDQMDPALLDSPAHEIRMAFFPRTRTAEYADYEMDLVFHENGVISDMLVEYENFSVRQSLLALEPLETGGCGSPEAGKGEGSD